VLKRDITLQLTSVGRHVLFLYVCLSPVTLSAKYLHLARKKCGVISPRRFHLGDLGLKLSWCEYRQHQPTTVLHRMTERAIEICDVIFQNCVVATVFIGQLCKAEPSILPLIICSASFPVSLSRGNSICIRHWHCHQRGEVVLTWLFVYSCRYMQSLSALTTALAEVPSNRGKTEFMFRFGVFSYHLSKENLHRI